MGRPAQPATPRVLRIGRYGTERPSEWSLRPEPAGYQRRAPAPMPPAKRLISQISATTAAMMNSQCRKKPPATSASATIRSRISSIRFPPPGVDDGRKTVEAPRRLRRDRAEHEHGLARLRLREAVGEDLRLGRRIDRLLLAPRDRVRQRRLRAQRLRQRNLELGVDVAPLQEHRVLRRRSRRR